MELRRTSGILLHPTSLPAPWGIGDLGPSARAFADFLAAAGQRWWQVLPLGPTGYGNSPYMSFSAVAGNPLLVSPDDLVREGLLASGELPPPPHAHEARVDYPAAIAWKRALLEQAFARFRTSAPAAHRQGLVAFREKHAEWLEDYALFTALKEASDDVPWTRWEPALIAREPGTLQERARRLRERVDLHCFLQYLFATQWAALREHCHARGVRIIGDLPIYVAHDSADVWTHPDLFDLDAHGHPHVVAGVPPDYFSATGQRWGNPLYRWEAQARTGYRWWVDRFRANLTLVDLLRLDHFRGFEAYWEIPADSVDAVTGRWVKGPGADFFGAVRRALGDLPVIAEDLGVITPEVEALRDECGLPGMRVLQMAFGDDPKAASYQPHNFSRHCVAYTTTHDHNTTVGWFTAEPGRETTQTAAEVARERALALAYLGRDGHEIHWDVIRLALASVADLAIVPLQDVLGLGSEARMNRPGTLRGNWEWRFTRRELDDALGARLGELTRLYGRTDDHGTHAV